MNKNKSKNPYNNFQSNDRSVKYNIFIIIIIIYDIFFIIILLWVFSYNTLQYAGF